MIYPRTVKKLRNMLDLSSKLNAMVDQLGKIEDIKEIEVGYI